MRDSRRGAEITMQSMLDVLERWHRLLHVRTTRTMKIGRTVPPHGGNGTQSGGIPIMRLHHKDGLNTDRTGKLVQSVNQLFICGMNLRKNLVHNLS